MSYDTKPADNAGRQAALLGDARTWRPRDGDSAYVEDCRRIKEAVQRLELHAAEVRKETSLLSTAPTYTGSREKVQAAVRDSLGSVEKVKASLETLASNGVQSVSEQHRRRLMQQKLLEDLSAASRKISKAWMEYEAADADRSRRGVPQAGAAGSAFATGMGMNTNRIGGVVGVEMSAGAGQQATSGHLQQQQQQLQQVQQVSVSVGEADMHSAIVDEYVGQISTLESDMRGLQRCMLDLAAHTQEQGIVLDSIEANMSQGAAGTQAATEQLVQASQQQRTGTKWICRLLIVAAVLAAIVIVVVSMKH